MNRLIIALSLGCGVMAASIAYALVRGDFWTEAGILFRYPWFHLSMIDLYVGFLVFGGWVAYREGSARTAAVWIVLVLALGNLATCAYALAVARRARGDWNWFWQGHRARAA
ncbi:MAG: DUF1475 family protein [Phycisphaerales bacterium]